MSGQELVETPSQLLPVPPSCLRHGPPLGGGLYRRSARTWSVIHSAVARDLASVAVRIMYESEASSSSSPGVASSWHGADRSAAALACLSAISLPSIPTWEGTQRTVIWSPRAWMRSQTSMAATAKRWGVRPHPLDRGGEVGENGEPSPCSPEFLEPT